MWRNMVKISSIKILHHVQAELFDPDQWADTFKRSGAKYIVLTSKHHDGFCMWAKHAELELECSGHRPHRDLEGI